MEIDKSLSIYFCNSYVVLFRFRVVHSEKIPQIWHAYSMRDYQKCLVRPKKNQYHTFVVGKFSSSSDCASYSVSNQFSIMFVYLSANAHPVQWEICSQMYVDITWAFVHTSEQWNAHHGYYFKHSGNCSSCHYLML